MHWCNVEFDEPGKSGNLNVARYDFSNETVDGRSLHPDNATASTPTNTNPTNFFIFNSKSGFTATVANPTLGSNNHTKERRLHPDLGGLGLLVQ